MDPAWDYSQHRNGFRNVGICMSWPQKLHNSTSVYSLGQSSDKDPPEFSGTGQTLVCEW